MVCLCDELVHKVEDPITLLHQILSRISQYHSTAVSYIYIHMHMHMIVLHTWSHDVTSS